MVIGAAAPVTTALPLYLVGALAVHLTEDLAFGAAGLGLAAALFRVASAATSVHLGRLADGLGASWSLRLAATVAALSCIGIGVSAVNWTTLVLWLMVGGCAVALGEAASNRLLVVLVEPRRLGAAFGVRSAAGPTASMLAGLSVPIVAAPLGWRWAFVLAASLAVAVVVTVGRRIPAARRHARARPDRQRLRDRRTLLLLATAVGLAIGAATTILTFYVDAAVRAGQSPAAAGTVLAVASVATISVRLVSGLACDRIAAGHLRISSAQLLVGSLGLALVATSRPGPMAVGAVLGLAGAWGATSVFWFALVRAYPEAPGAVTGAVLPGSLVGGIVNPIVFGFLAEGGSYPTAWTYAAVVAVLAAGAMLVGNRRLASIAAVE